MRKISFWIAYIAVIILMIWGIPRALSTTLKTPHPMASITSSSMWPALSKGDLVFIRGVEPSRDINVGDVIVFKNSEGFTIHRVISKDEKGVITKGDANNVADPPINYSEIVGKALSYDHSLVKIPFIGNISIMIKNIN